MLTACAATVMKTWWLPPTWPLSSGPLSWERRRRRWQPCLISSSKTLWLRFWSRTTKRYNQGKHDQLTRTIQFFLFYLFFFLFFYCFHMCLINLVRRLELLLHVVCSWLTRIRWWPYCCPSSCQDWKRKTAEFSLWSSIIKEMFQRFISFKKNHI